LTTLSKFNQHINILKINIEIISQLESFVKSYLKNFNANVKILNKGGKISASGRWMLVSDTPPRPRQRLLANSKEKTINGNRATVNLGLDQTRVEN
jgi:hypothetical protein